MGAFGIQFGFALPQANATRIFQNLGASLENVPLLWLAGPITGLIVQPLVGYYSDRTWTRFGRRRPYFLIGAALAAGMLIAMPNATTLWMAVLIFGCWMRRSISPWGRSARSSPTSCRRTTRHGLFHLHVLCEPGRGGRQPVALGVRAAGRVDAPAGEISTSVKYAFYIGAMLLVAAVCWSALARANIPPRCSRNSTGPAAEPHRSGLRPGCAAMPVPGSGWVRLAWRRGTPRAHARALRTDLRRARLRRVPAGGQPHEGRERVHDHSRRTRIHVRVHALAGAGAVFLLVRAVCGLRLHHSRGGQDAFRFEHTRFAGLRSRRKLGRRVVRHLQRAGCAGGAGHSLVRAAFRHAPHAPDQPVAGRGRPAVHAADTRSRLAAGVDDRARHSPGPPSFPCPTPCWPTTCRRGRWA